MPAFLRLFTGKGIKSDGGFLCNRRHHIKGGTTMYEKRALSKNQFAESGIDTSDYRFIETEGDFVAILDLKVWGNRNLRSFFTLEDGRKIIACTFPRENYLGLADTPIGSVFLLIFQQAKKSGQVYLQEVVQLEDDEFCPIL